MFCLSFLQYFKLNAPFYKVMIYIYFKSSKAQSCPRANMRKTGRRFWHILALHKNKYSCLRGYIMTPFPFCLDFSLKVDSNSYCFNNLNSATHQMIKLIKNEFIACQIKFNIKHSAEKQCKTA